MAIARRIDEWDRTCLLWSTLANIHRDPKKRGKPFHPNEAHPLSELKPKEAPRPVREAVEAYKRGQSL